MFLLRGRRDRGRVRRLLRETEFNLPMLVCRANYNVLKIFDCFMRKCNLLLLWNAFGNYLNIAVKVSQS